MIPDGAPAVELEMAQPIRGLDERRARAGRRVRNAHAVMARAKTDLLRQCRRHESSRASRVRKAQASEARDPDGCGLIVAQQHVISHRYNHAPFAAYRSMHVLFEDDGQLKAG